VNNYETLSVTKEAQTIVVQLNRQKSKNSLNMKMKEELDSVLDEIEQDDEARVVILTGGKNLFCAGSDIKERASIKMNQYDFYFSQRKTEELFCRLEDFQKPVIAAIGGVAVGGGLEMALACDLRIASEKAMFGLPEVKIGIMPAGGGTQRLPRLIGITKAKELLYTGQMFNAQSAFQMGILNDVVQSDHLLDAAKKLAEKIIENPPLSVKLIKRAINVGVQLDLKSALEYEVSYAAMLYASKDREEGFNAFIEKRKPDYKGY
jgi:enoyl-CoA hydratase